MYDDKYNDSLIFKIDNELDLNIKVVSFLKKRYPTSIFIATLGENQDAGKKKIVSHKKGYLHGSPDLVINNLHKYYIWSAIEFKNPKGIGVLSYDQSKMLQQYENNGFKTLVSNDYDYIIEYFKDVRIKCHIVQENFISSWSLKNQTKIFHKSALIA